MYFVFAKSAFSWVGVVMSTVFGQSLDAVLPVGGSPRDSIFGICQPCGGSPHVRRIHIDDNIDVQMNK